MSRPKGGKNRKWTANEKIRIINRYLNGEGSLIKIASEEKISDGQLSNWITRYEKEGYDGIDRKPGNKFGGFHNKKNPTKLEQLEYENFKLKMEVEMLKKGLDPEKVVSLEKKKKD